jgi:hypothetical protein
VAISQRQQGSSCSSGVVCTLLSVGKEKQRLGRNGMRNDYRLLHPALFHSALDGQFFEIVEFCMGFVEFRNTPPPVGNTPSAPTPHKMAVEFPYQSPAS